MATGPVIILGSGLTGLSAAVALKRRGIAVTVLESAALAGGAVQTESGWTARLSTLRRKNVSWCAAGHRWRFPRVRSAR
jgi:monoamine oxidase